METLQIQKDLSNIAEIKISYRPKFKACERPMITCSEDSYKIMYECWNKDTIAFQEEFKILLLNYGNRVLGFYHVATGGMAGVIVDVKQIFGVALKSCASKIILAHNHPSGNLKTSQADVTITQRFIAVGKLLELPVLDHIILTPDSGYYSFADEGLM